MLARLPRLSSRYINNFRSFNNFPHDNTPEDPKYAEFNNQYVEMFTPGAKVGAPSETNVMSELDDLNAEFSSIFEVKSLKSHEFEDLVLSEKPFTLISNTNDPYINLAMEEYVFRTTPKNQFSNRLLFYINNPCVVIGKNQNPWKEVKNQNEYDLIRRYSGGGTVVHDLGNVNYSYLSTRNAFDRAAFNTMIVNVCNPLLTKPLSLNERGDIVQGEFKVSGSAYKIAGGKAYHHGTMLLNSDLTKFRQVLQPKVMENVEWKCQGVDSVRSSVANVTELTEDQFISVVSNAFNEKHDSATYYIDEDAMLAVDTIAENVEKLKSDEWKFNSTPKFSVTTPNGEFTVEKGIIVDSSDTTKIGQPFMYFM